MCHFVPIVEMLTHYSNIFFTVTCYLQLTHSSYKYVSQKRLIYTLLFLYSFYIVNANINVFHSNLNSFFTHIFYEHLIFYKHIILVEHLQELIYIAYILLMIEVHFADNIRVLLLNVTAINESRSRNCQLWCFYKPFSRTYAFFFKECPSCRTAESGSLMLFNVFKLACFWKYASQIK